jgi:hypothetical protein
MPSSYELTHSSSGTIYIIALLYELQVKGASNSGAGQFKQLLDFKVASYCCVAEGPLVFYNCVNGIQLSLKRVER